jgi:hypothetical protein
MKEPIEVLTIAEVVDFAAKAAREAYNTIKESGGEHEAAQEAARTAFKCCMPTLESRAAVQAYIATVVRGMELRLLTLRESQQYIKAARLWISAEMAGRAA